MGREDQCWSCGHCGIVWFSREEACAYFRLSQPVAVAPAAGNDESPSLVLTESLRFCPVCASAPYQVAVGSDLVVDLCEGCGGLLFDAGESLSLKGKLAVGHAAPRFRQLLSSLVFSGVPGSRGPYR